MAEDVPFVSVIMPVRNESDFIERAITSVLASDYPAEKIEVIIVDGVSDDGTRETVERLSRKDNRIKILNNPKLIVSTAMNIGLKYMSGDVFIRIDGHAEVPTDFVSKSVECLREHPQAWVAGGSIETVADSYIGRAIASAMRSPVGVGNARFRLGDYEGWVDTIAFGIHHRWIIEKIGYFDEELVRNQDDEFNQRIILAGGKIWMSKSIRSKYFSRNSFGKLWRQYFQYGFWRIKTMQKHKRPASLRQLAPLLFVSSLLLIGLSGLFWSLARIIAAIEAGLYFLGLTAGALDVGHRSGLKYVPLAPIIFAILHFAYGFGSLWGVIRFCVLRECGMKSPEQIQLSR